MPNQHILEVAEQRAIGSMRWLTLRSPELARGVRPGQYLLVRCAEGSFDPLLRRALFVAAAEEALGQIALLYTSDEPGLFWLARARSGDRLDVLGPFGKSFELARQTRTLLLIGQGSGLSALVLLAAQAARRGCTVTLLAGAADEVLLPPPFLLPSDVEYQSAVGQAIDLLGVTADDPQVVAHKSRKPSAQNSALSTQNSQLISWADQVCAALPSDQIAPLRDAVRTTKVRWERGFASVLLESPLVCGVGACAVCLTNLRQGARLLCSDGPVVDLRDA